jgi:uncharacterized damage-inducible protein DinB
MFSTIQQFIEEWNQEAASTQKVLDALTDESLQQRVSQEDDRTLGSIAWHIVTSTPGMLIEFGVNMEAVGNATNVPTSAMEIAETFRRVSADTSDAVRQQWTDQSLGEMKNVYGRDMLKSVTLSMLVKHIIHHRAQLTILMRQAGVKVPGVYGPSREEWSQLGVDSSTL